MSSVRRLEEDAAVAVWLPVGRDAALASEVLKKANIRCKRSVDVEDLCAAALDESTGLLVLGEEALNSESIAKIQHALAQQPPWSDLPVVLLTGGGQSSERSLAMLRRMQVLGQFILLERPLRSVTFVAAVQSARAARNRQYQIRDYIAELERARQELAQANADLKQFAFAASHDLQEPLRMVNVFTQMLLDRHVDQSDSDAQQFAGFVRNGVKRMEALLRDLLSYSRIVHGDREWKNETFDLGLAVSDAMQSLLVQIQASKAQITVKDLPVVNGDRTQLSLVFQNLIGNAIKYAKEDVPPVIEISSESNATEHVIQTKDNGIGFEQIYAERIFELFQRLNNSDVSGTGLGLAITKRILERHGGRIWAKSEVDVGSTFLFTLPFKGQPSGTGKQHESRA